MNNKHRYWMPIYLFNILNWIIEWYINSKVMHKYCKKLNNIKIIILMINELLWKKKWHSLNTNKQNKPKMAQFFKSKFKIALKLNFNGGYFIKISKFGYFKERILDIKIVKFEVKFFEYLHCKVWCWKIWAFALKY